VVGVNQYPLPPWPEPPAGSVLAWRTRVGAESYTYVGLRLAGHGWYLTGQLTTPLSWGALCFHFPPEDGRFLALSVTGQITAGPG
jgi:hypothetical protein